MRCLARWGRSAGRRWGGKGQQLGQRARREGAGTVVRGDARSLRAADTGSAVERMIVVQRGECGLCLRERTRSTGGWGTSLRGAGNIEQSGVTVRAGNAGKDGDGQTGVARWGNERGGCGAREAFCGAPHRRSLGRAQRGAVHTQPAQDAGKDDHWLLLSRRPKPPPRHRREEARHRA